MPTCMRWRAEYLKLAWADPAKGAPAFEENTPGQEFDVIRSLCPPKAFPAAFDVNSEIVIPNFQPVRLSGLRSRKENFWIGECLGAGDCLSQ